MAKNQNEKYMHRALALAILGHPSPNPFVGAVIVKGGKIIGEGYHHQAGHDHAEVDAIKDVYRKNSEKKAKKLLTQSTLFVSLEPCAHFGRTPPCTKAILEAGIGKVVFATKDPNPNVEGDGEKILKKAGIKVEKGMLHEAAQEINLAFLYHLKTGLPYVTLKMAMRADGSVKKKPGQSHWISGPEEQHMVHLLRNRVGAIMVGIGTVMDDDPRLTTRLGGGKKGHDPLRVIVDASLQIPMNAQVLKDKNVLLAVGMQADPAKMMKLHQQGAEIFQLPYAPGKKLLSLRPLLYHLERKGIDHVLCEGGPGLARSLADEGMIDEMILAIAPPEKKEGRADAKAGAGTHSRNLDPDGEFLVGLANKLGKPTRGRAGKDLIVMVRKA